jgi:hypothetical protein
MPRLMVLFARELVAWAEDVVVGARPLCAGATLPKLIDDCTVLKANGHLTAVQQTIASLPARETLRRISALPQLCE